MPKDQVKLLSAAWINARVESVMNKAEALLDHLIDDGLLSSGYFPLEEPLSPKVIRRATAEQVQGLLDQSPAIEDQARLLEALDDLPSSVVPEPGQS